MPDSQVTVRCRETKQTEVAGKTSKENPLKLVTSVQVVTIGHEGERELA